LKKEDQKQDPTLRNKHQESNPNMRNCIIYDGGGGHKDTHNHNPPQLVDQGRVTVGVHDNEEKSNVKEIICRGKGLQKKR